MTMIVDPVSTIIFHISSTVRLRGPEVGDVQHRVYYAVGSCTNFQSPLADPRAAL